MRGRVSNKFSVGTILLSEPNRPSTTLLIANSVSKVEEDHKTCCLVANLEIKPCSLPPGFQLATFDTVQETKEEECAENFPVAATVPVANHKETVQAGDNLSVEQLHTESTLSLIFFSRFSLI